jgi:hypothetical protein
VFYRSRNDSRKYQVLNFILSMLRSLWLDSRMLRVRRRGELYSESLLVLSLRNLSYLSNLAWFFSSSMLKYLMLFSSYPMEVFTFFRYFLHFYMTCFTFPKLGIALASMSLQILFRLKEVKSISPSMICNRFSLR